MKTFTLTVDMNITAWASAKDAARESEAALVFDSMEDLDAAMSTFNIKPVALWNTLPGLTPVTKFMKRSAGITRIWKAIQSLAPVEPAPAKIAKTTRANRATSDAASRVRKALTTSPRDAQASHTPRDGSKEAQAVALLSRANGATLDELMTTFGWQKHTVRGFIAGAAKRKLGLNIESFKTAANERAYKVIA